jgi:hypothetical protein
LRNTPPVFELPERRWECPNCDLTAVTRELGIGNRYHNCKGLLGLSAPMVPAGTKAKVEAKEREDYIGEDHGRVQLTDVDGKQVPIMSIVTTRDDGQDCTVRAPSAGGFSRME